MTDSTELLDELPSNALWTDPENHVGYVLKGLGHVLRQSIESALREVNLATSMAQLATLGAIHAEPGLPGAQLAKRLLITAQSMNAILKGLAEADRVRWEPSSTNQRAQNWYITAAGMQMLESAAIACEPVFEQMQSQLNAAERAQLIALLRRCMAGLNE